MIKGFTFLLVSILMLGALGSAFPESLSQKDLARIVPVQDAEKNGRGGDPYFLSLVKQLREKVDGWLKSLNERIEREDVTRLEVRFLEILRSILEWVKEKLDAKIESEENKPRKTEREGDLPEERGLKRAYQVPSAPVVRISANQEITRDRAILG